VKVPVPLYGDVPPVAETVTVVVPPKHEMKPEEELAERGVEHTLKVLEVFLGFGVLAEKLEALLFVSVQPFPALNTEVVFDGAGVGPVPSKQLAAPPKPTKSITPTVGHEPVRAVVLFTKATFPTVALIAIVPVASGVGSVTPLVPPACLIKKYCPGFKLTFGKVVTDQLVPVDEVYCTDIPLRLTIVLDRLNNSIKSFWYGAPVLPPPP